MTEKITSKGSSWEIKPGVYQYRFSLSKDPKTGERRYSPKRTLHCKTKNKRGREAELRKAMELYRKELEEGVVSPVATAKTVGEYANEFHKLRKGTMRSELSYKRERLDIDHINDLFGDLKLSSLKPPIIKKAYADAREEGRYSESELHKIHTKLSQIMKEAVKDELIVKNPCSAISIPRPAAKERNSLTVEDASRLLAVLNEEYAGYIAKPNDVPSIAAMPKIIAVMLLLESGMRRGEMIGLQWKHVDFERGSIYICQQFTNDKVLREPKSKNSRRHLYLSEDMMKILAQWQPIEAEFFALRKIPFSADSPVVCNEICSFMDPNNFNRWFRDWCVKNGFGSLSNETTVYYDSAGRRRLRKKGYTGLTPHMLRHTQATLLIGASADIKTVQTRLGHSSINLTLDTYSHAIAANDKKAAETFRGLIANETVQIG